MHCYWAEQLAREKCHCAAASNLATGTRTVSFTFIFFLYDFNICSPEVYVLLYCAIDAFFLLNKHVYVGVHHYIRVSYHSQIVNKKIVL